MVSGVDENYRYSINKVCARQETLYNWLMPVIANSRCLDCFSGSGSLGFEAASRGAQNVTLLEKDKQVANQLKKNKQ